MSGSLRPVVIAITALALVGAGLWTLTRMAPSEARQASTGTPMDWGAIVAAVPPDAFQRLSRSWQLDLPADHAAHDEAPTETWTIAAHLRAEDGRRIGIQFGLFRVAVGPTDVDRDGSAWTARDIYRGHVTLLDPEAARNVAEERFNRGVLGLAGHAPEEPSIWLDDWTLAFDQEAEGLVARLSATAGGTTIELALRPEKDLFRASPDGEAPFRGYSLTRMSAAGRIGAEGEVHLVEGNAWLDHLWGDLPLPLGPIVYDGLQVQLDDGSEMAVFRTRRRDGGGTPTLDGYRIDTAGAVEWFPSGALTMEPTRTWRRSADAAAYPIEWRLDAGDTELRITPLLDDQVQDFVDPVWSGFIAAEGARAGSPLAGFGTLQLTGYSDR